MPKARRTLIKALAKIGRKNFPSSIPTVTVRYMLEKKGGVRLQTSSDKSKKYFWSLLGGACNFTKKYFKSYKS